MIHAHGLKLPGIVGLLLLAATGLASIFAALDPSTLNSLILAIIALLSASTVYLQQKNAARSDRKQEAISKVVDNTHTLINSQYTASLQLVAQTSRALANLSKNPSDVTAADRAEKKLLDHQTGQDVVDLTPAPPSSGAK